MMNAVANTLRRFLRDSIFVRVCVGIYALIFLGLGGAMVAAFMPPQSFEWILVVMGVGVGGLGLYGLYAAVFGRLQLLDKAAHMVSDGGEVVGLLFLAVVLIAALPITATIKFLRSIRKKF